MNKEHAVNKKIPEVKMTKTTRMRLLKANPLMKYQIEKTNKDMTKHVNLDTISLLNKSDISKLKSNVSQNYEKTKENTMFTKKVGQFTKPMKNDGDSKRIKAKPSLIKKTEVKCVRRSVSAPRLKQSIKGKISSMPNDPEETLNRSASVDDLLITKNQPVIGSTHNQSKSCGSQSMFAYPSSLPPRATPSAPVELRRRLTEWLDKKQKKLSSFKHLKCFGVHKIDLIEEENKENYETTCLNKAGSYEALEIDKPLHNDMECSDVSLVFAPSDLLKVTLEAIRDLNCLISEEYPIEHCEAWLRLMRNKCPQIVESPEYWECRATIEQSRGDISSAVESYKTAVVQGAEVTSVQQSLNQLLHKFKLLEIDSSTDQRKATNQRVKVMQDFKNVFTSTIIKFAIQEKNIKNSKNKELNEINSSTRLQVTPVRRSTRLSRSLYTSTPGTKICSSLNELKPDEKEKIIFKPNTALYD